MPQTIHMPAIESSLSSRQRLKGPRASNTGHSTVPSLHVLLSDASIGTRTVLRKSVERIPSRASIRSALHEPDLVTAKVFVGHDGIFMRREDELAAIFCMHFIEELYKLLGQHGMKAPAELIGHEGLLMAMREEEIHKIGEPLGAIRFILEAEIIQGAFVSDLEDSGRGSSDPLRSIPRKALSLLNMTARQASGVQKP